jgi:hypothetical protein
MTTRNATSVAATGAESPPWWRYKMVWLVVGGPLVVVVASFITLALAIRFPDPVLDTSGTTATRNAAEVPALQARNHSATGGVK